MNRFIGIGTLPRNAVLKGKNQNVLRFTLETSLGKNKKTEKEYFAYVPCVVFRPSEETIKLLTEYEKGVFIGLQGKVNTSRFESKGQTKYATDVIVDEATIKVVEEDDFSKLGAKAA